MNPSGTSKAVIIVPSTALRRIPHPACNRFAVTGRVSVGQPSTAAVPTLHELPFALTNLKPVICTSRVL